MAGGSDADQRVVELMGSVRGIAFDKDGTLVDLDARWVPFFLESIDRVALGSGDPTLVARLRSILGVDEDGLVPDGPAAVETLDHIIDRMIGELIAGGHERDRAAELVAAADLGTGYGPLRPLGPVVSALGELRTRGHTLAIATSDGRGNTIDELAALGVTELIDTMRCGDDDGAVKPDPVVLVSIAAEWGIDVVSLLFVGDSRQDLATARAAGAPFAARCDPERVPSWAVHADAVIVDIGELVVS